MRKLKLFSLLTFLVYCPAENKENYNSRLSESGKSQAANSPNYDTYVQNIKNGKYKIKLGAGTDGVGRIAASKVKPENIPANVEKVLVNIKQIQFVGQNGPIDVQTRVGSYDLLAINENLTPVFGSGTLPKGIFHQIRLILDDNNGAVQASGVLTTLKVPSGAQTGLKLNGSFEIESGLITRLSVDFDLKDLHFNQGQGYILNPVLAVSKIEMLAPFKPGYLIVKLKTAVTIQTDSAGRSRTGIASVDLLNDQFECGIIERMLDLYSFPNLDMTIASNIGMDRVYVFIFRSTTDILLAMEKYVQDPNVEQVFPDNIVEPTVVPNDTLLGSQNHFTDINAYTGWDVSTGSASSLVAVLDTGIDDSHPDLSGKVVQGRAFTTGTCQKCNSCGCENYSCAKSYGQSNAVDRHGTHVAGIIGAKSNNATGVAGVDWQTRLLSIRVLECTGDGAVCPPGVGPTGSDISIGAGIIEAADSGARVINMSLGGYGSSICFQFGIFTGATEFCVDSHPQEWYAVQYAAAKNVVIVAAAGNDNRLISGHKDGSGVQSHYPASYPQVISVGALTTTTLNRAGFSNFGKVDIAAPGNPVYSTLPFSITGFYYGYLGGTSMAAPVVSGLASLILSVRPNYTATQVRQIIQSTATDAGPIGQPDIQTGYGRVNVSAALNAVKLSLSGATVGLTAPGLVLANNGADFQGIGSNGVYSFATKYGNNLAYNVTVSTPPIGQSCTIYNGTGTFNGDDVRNILVRCQTAGDVVPPNTVSNFGASPGPSFGNCTVNLTWQNPIDLDYFGGKIIRKANSAPTSVSDGFQIFDSTANLNSIPQNASPETTINAFTDTDNVQTNTQYYYAFFSVDTSNNISSSAIASTFTPSSCTPFGTGGGGGCFIATAAYGSYMHDDVMILRRFRDKILLKSSIGRKFVEHYYQHSPYFAKKISNSESLKMISRTALYPIVSTVAIFMDAATIGHYICFVLCMSVVFFGGILIWRQFRYESS